MIISEKWLREWVSPEISTEDLAHQITAPPLKVKNDRKNEVAAKAMEMPKTIWISRRKPPEVSPKASDRPVMMIMITAMILATGPSIDSRMAVRGASQGMLEPAAWAAGEETTVGRGAAVDFSAQPRRATRN